MTDMTDKTSFIEENIINSLKSLLSRRNKAEPGEIGEMVLTLRITIEEAGI
jgi:hypothetical protein